MVGLYIFGKTVGVFQMAGAKKTLIFSGHGCKNKFGRL